MLFKVKPPGFKYELREVDALHDGEWWSWNASYRIGSFVVRGSDEKRAFIRALAKHGIKFKKGRTRITYDGDVFEVVDRKSWEPLYAALPIGEV